MASAGEVLRRERIMHEVWGPQCFGWTKTLDVHISWLRTNIEDDASHPTRITTVTTD
jgi:two-component system, OmpR family, response regulator RegX3